MTAPSNAARAGSSAGSGTGAAPSLCICCSREGSSCAWAAAGNTGNAQRRCFQENATASPFASRSAACTRRSRIAQHASSHTRASQDYGPDILESDLRNPHQLGDRLVAQVVELLEHQKPDHQANRLARNDFLNYHPICTSLLPTAPSSVRIHSRHRAAHPFTWTGPRSLLRRLQQLSPWRIASRRQPLASPESNQNN